MEEIHRYAIRRNAPKLAEIANDSFANLLNELKRRKVFTEIMINDIQQSPYPLSDKKLKLFMDIQRRGPTAFEELIQSLCVIGSTDLAVLLRTDIEVNNSDEIEVSSDVAEGGSNFEGNDEVDATVIERPHARNISENNKPEFELTEVHKNISGNSEGTIPNPPADSEITLATLYNNGERRDCYPMKSKPRGKALVINVIKFPEAGKERKGASADTENLRKLFRQLDFTATFVEDPTEEDLSGEDGAINKFINEFSADPADCCIVVVMSHGEEHYKIRMSDGNYIDFYRVIQRKFSNEKFKKASGKPKAFFFQACRGKSYNHVLNDISSQSQSPEPQPISTKRFKADGSNENKRKTLRGPSDIIIINSTVPGFKSMRDEKKGTIFILSVCDVIRKHAHHMHLEEMINLINEELAEQYDYDHGREVRQNVHTEKMFPFKKLYFNPGLYPTNDDLRQIDDGA